MSKSQESSKMEFSASVRMAFRFVKKHIVRQTGTEQPFWQGFDEDDMFTSIEACRVIEAGHSDDGDVLLLRTVSFKLKGDQVAIVELEGKRDPWGHTYWAVSRCLYRRYWGADRSRDPEWTTRYVLVGGCYQGDVYATS